MDTWTYAPAPESAALARLQPSYRPFVDGGFIDSGGEPLKTVNPATGEVLAEVGTADESDVDRAVAAARLAFETTWGPMPGAERAKYLFRIARIVAERARELAVLETLDNGKPIRESRDVDVPTASAHLFHHAGWADKLQYAGLGPDPRPLGVVGAVIPWNFPLLMAAWKIAPALACGNTIVLKPAETTPLTALVLAEIAAEAGLPAGVLNVLPGAGDVGSALVGHDGLDKVAFTGSTEVGKQIQGRLAGTGRRLTLELGGKAANIVYDDAPLDQAVEGVIEGIFFNQGHVCCAGSRLLVQESIADEFDELAADLGNRPREESATRFYELAERFDQALINACHNEPLATTIADRRGQTARLRGIAHADPRGMERSLEEHRRVCRAMLDGDPGAAAHELTHHLAETLRTITEGLTRNAGREGGLDIEILPPSA